MRFPEFSEVWNFKYGNEVLENISNKNHNSDLPVLAITQEYGAIPRDLIDYKISVTDKSVEGYKVVEKGDFIISLRSFQGGIEYSDYHGICSPAYIILRPKIEIIDKFFKFYLKTQRYITSLNKKLEGIRDGKMISYKYFSEIALPFPSIEEQSKIADFLSLLDSKIQTQKKIIQNLETLIKGLCQKLSKNKNWKRYYLRDILTERKETNKDNLSVFSVSVSRGVINQIEYLGRSFSAKNTDNYNVVHFGDIVYTKSPTGEFPYGIIKQSFIENKVAVSPLYGAYVPKNIYIGNILHYYFSNPINTNNYLHSLVQKGAKNTINITNQRFLDNEILLPTDEKEVKTIALLLNSINNKIETEKKFLELLEQQKKYFLQNMFI